MSLDACAALVARGDPDRYLAVMAAPVWCRARLFPLYAFNLEVARAPWVTQEPMIAEMRLQWWRDAVAEMAGTGPVRAHEVALPLAGVVRGQGLDPAVLDRLVAARRWDIGRDPFADQAALDGYLEDTGAALMALAVAALGAGPDAAATARAVGWAAGLAAFLCAVAELQARGRVPLVDPRPAAVAALARRGLERLEAARIPVVTPAAVPALRTAWQAGPILRQAAREPARVAEGQLALSEFARRGRLLWAVARGSW